jgi:hypothetical protein
MICNGCPTTPFEWLALLLQLLIMYQMMGWVATILLIIVSFMFVGYLLSLRR